MQNKVFLYWHSNDLPQEYQTYIENNKKLCPNLEFVLFNKDLARNYIKNNYSQDCLFAYDKLKPYAFKSDLFRYCIINKEGGIYTDTKVQFTNSFKPWIKNQLIDNSNKCVLLQDYHHGQESYTQPDNTIITYPAIQNCFILSPKNNDLIQLTIQNIIQNTKDNYYGQTSLSITGPGLLGRLYQSNKLHNIRILPIALWQTLFHIKFQIRNQSHDQSHYHHMWHNKDIYNNI